MEQPLPTLRSFREQRRLTREQLAAAAEVATSTVYNAESGRVRPQPAILRRLARALDVTPQEIELPTPAQSDAGHDQTILPSAST